MKYIFIINGRTDKAPSYEELRLQIEALADQMEYDFYTTKGIGDATRFTRIYCDLHPLEEVCFVACGGDGTVNEVVSGMMGFERKQLAVLNYGETGHDYTLNFPNRDFKSVAKMLNAPLKQVDVVRVNDSYFINSCNVGFDARVASTANDKLEEGHSPKSAYRQGILFSLLFGRYNRINVTVDGKCIGKRYMTMCTLANGRIIGSGQFIPAPNAHVDDGVMDVCFLRPVTLLRLLITMPFYQKGTHFDTPFIRRRFIYRQAKHVELSCNHITHIVLDGEILPGASFVMDCLPGAVSMRLPEE